MHRYHTSFQNDYFFTLILLHSVNIVCVILSLLLDGICRQLIESNKNPGSFSVNVMSLSISLSDPLINRRKSKLFLLWKIFLS